MDILVVVDMQNDFVDGALGTKEAVEIVPLVAEKIKKFHGELFFTQDTHMENYLNTQEGEKLPVKHCIKNSQGWKLCPEIEKLKNERVIEKPTFGSAKLAEVLKERNDDKEKIDTVTLVGLCTDICVISNAMLIKTFLPEARILVDASCCAGVTVESHRQALEVMKMCQVEVENG